MISREKYLLNCIAEEANEIAIRASKAVRFGLEEVQPGQTKTNRARLVKELIDLATVVEMAGIKPLSSAEAFSMMEAKREKVEKFYDYSVSLKEAKPR